MRLHAPGLPVKRRETAVYPVQTSNSLTSAPRKTPSATFAND